MPTSSGAWSRRAAAQGSRLPVQDRLDGLPEVAGQVPAIGNLDGVRSTLSRVFRIGMPTVARDNLHARMRFEPVGKLRGGGFG